MAPCGKHAATPVRLRGTVCGLSAALSVTESMPVILPALLGIKVTLIGQLVACARFPTQLSLSAKLAVAAIPETFSGGSP
jgi:hypothetical protein